MGASKQTETSESTSTTTPAASPQAEFALRQNRNLFNQLQNRTFPEFSTVAEFSPTTQAALDQTAARARAGSAVNAAGKSAVANIATNGAFGPGGVPANAAAQFFLPTARGDFLDFSNNPFFQKGVGAVSDSVGSIFERAGRTGSGANQSSVARGIGDLAAGVFNEERAKQLSAAQQLGSLFQGDIANQFNNASTRLQAAGQAPALAATDFADLNALVGVGQTIDNKTQQNIDEQVARFNFPFDNAIAANQALNGGIIGLGPLLGNTTNSSGENVSTSSPGLLNTILGAIATGGSIIAKSDRRLKTAIRKIGTLTNGLGLYRWRWNDEAAEIGLTGNASGVIAQEVQKILPQAVSTLDGYLAVDYGQVLEAQQ